MDQPRPGTGKTMKDEGCLKTDIALDASEAKGNGSHPVPPSDSGIQLLDHPDLKTVLLNMGEWSFTTFMWAVWIYLFLPLINILLWIFGGHLFYVSVVDEAHYRDAVTMFQNMGIFVLIVFLILRGWGYYNYHRFGKLSRRKAPLPASAEQMAGFFKLTTAEVLALQHQKEVVWEKTYENS